MDYPILSICLGVVFSLLAAALAGGALAWLGFPLPPGKRRIGRIDGLRGFLALSVMMHHFVIWTQITRLGGSWSQPDVYFFNQMGAGGVSLFFMVTGLLFYPRILAGFRANNWPEIFIGRVFRIVPLVVVTVAVVTLISVLQSGHGPGAGFPLAALRWITATAMPPLAGDADSGRMIAYVLWSLKYEWQFYLIVLPSCALAIDFIGGRTPSWVLPLALILLSLLGQAFASSIGMFKFLPLFAAGMLAYEAKNAPRISQWMQTPVAALIAGCALAVGMTQFVAPYTIALPLFALFFTAVACGNDFGGLFSSKASLVLGECSYSIYLMHGLVLYLLFTFGTALTGLFPTYLLPMLMPLAAIVVVLLTAVTYLLVERSGIDMGRVLIRRWRALVGRDAPATRLKGS
jgi:peptidoglycan/LPS O-acetylase OafA/YrhL